jgi:hypothetical protein
MRFEGTTSYVATEDLKVAVNAAVTLRRPLLVKGRQIDHQGASGPLRI